MRKYHCDNLPKTSILEPFIALYVKAINRCGVRTVGSCDGNHPEKRFAYLQFYGEPFRIWHTIICEYILGPELTPCWDAEGKKLFLNDSTKYEQYYRVYKAACYLLANSEYIAAIKDAALHQFSEEDFLSIDSPDIESFFRKYVAESFCFFKTLFDAPTGRPWF